jgi:hypothetical protein
MMLAFLLFLGATARMMLVPAIIVSGVSCGWLLRIPVALLSGGALAVILALLVHADIRQIYSAVLSDGMAQASFLVSVFVAGCIWALFANVVRQKFFGRVTSEDVAPGSEET